MQPFTDRKAAALSRAGTIQQLTVEYEPGTAGFLEHGHDEHQLFIRTPVGRLRRLLFPTDIGESVSCRATSLLRTLSQLTLIVLTQ